MLAIKLETSPTNLQNRLGAYIGVLEYLLRPLDPLETAPYIPGLHWGQMPVQTSGSPWDVSIEISFGCSVHSNSKPPLGQKVVQKAGIFGTCSVGTWDIGPWLSLVLSTRGCSAGELTDHRAAQHRKRVNKPCENYAHTSQILQRIVSNVLVDKSSACTYREGNRRRGICMLDMSRRSGPGRCHTHRLQECPSARSRRRSTS